MERRRRHSLSSGAEQHRRAFARNFVPNRASNSLDFSLANPFLTRVKNALFLMKHPFSRRIAALSLTVGLLAGTVLVHLRPALAAPALAVAAGGQLQIQGRTFSVEKSDDTSLTLTSAGAPSLAELFLPGDEVVVGGQSMLAKEIGADHLTLVTRPAPTASLGDFIQAAATTGTPGQGGTGRGPGRTADGSGLYELVPGTGTFVHNNGDGDTSWNTGGGDPAFLQYDLGQQFNVNGFYVWNYGGPAPWVSRGLKEIQLDASDDGQTFKSVGQFALAGEDSSNEIRAQAVKFDAPIKARFFKITPISRFGSDAWGLSEIRFANADKKYVMPSRDFKSKYPRPTYPQLKQGEILKGAENIVFPADSGVIDLSQAPYNAKGDGTTDDTDAIQRALNDHPNQGAILYLPNGRYLVSRQLRWGGGDDMRGGGAAKQTLLWGQSRGGTIIQLKDRAPGFVDARAPRGVIWTGAAPAQRFGNEVAHLTIDTGLKNPGACGLQFIANNQGGVTDVSIQSGDGQGAIALDLAYTDEQGPMLIKNVSTLGFDYGIKSGTSVASWAGEDITVRLPNIAGFQNNGQPASLRHFQFEGDVPAVQNNAGLLVLLDSTIKGTGAAKELTAVNIAGGAALVRNLSASGFKTAVEDAVAHAKIVGPKVAEHRSLAPKTMLVGAEKTLSLPVKETPQFPWPAPGGWTLPQTRDSDGIQAAIDAGGQDIYLPRGEYRINKTIIVRGNVRHILGGKAWFNMAKPLGVEAAPIWRIADGAAGAVCIEGITCDFSQGPFTFVDHASKRTFVMKRCATHGGSNTCYTNSVEGGEVFFEDVVTGRMAFKNQQIWARQFNLEPNGLRLLVDGGSLWALGYKSETEGSLGTFKNGAQVEILGGLSQTNGGHVAPMFTNENSNVSLFYSEVNNWIHPFTTFVVATKGEQTEQWGDPNTGFRGWRAIVYEGRLAAK